MHTHSRWIVSVALLGASQLTPAAAPHPCTRILDDSARLACYDQAFGTPAEPKALPEPPPPRRAADLVPERLTAQVVKVEWFQGRFTVTLDNGQVWRQSERDSRVQLEPQETVTVRRASLGSFFMTGKQGLAARVKLLE